MYMSANLGDWRSRLLILGLVLLGTLFPFSYVQAQQGGANLLVNGDFEWWDMELGRWPFQDGIPEVQVCPGWRAFYVDTPPAKAQAPNYWRRPEFRDVIAGEYPDRVRSGFRAAKYFSFAGQHEAGFYQQVGGIAPETPLRFSIYMKTWSCMPDGQWNVCPTKDKSNRPAPMRTKVGIDPTGGTNPWSSNVVWSPEIDAYDVWTYFQVEAIARNSTVTVFTYSWADWTDGIFRINNDVYIDDASLIALNEVLATPTPEPATAAPTATPDPSLPTETPAPTATPAATATPRPDGAVVHVVELGDTLNVIARQYQVPAATLLQLNDLTDANVLLVGQELVISVPESTATPLPTPTLAPPTPTAAPTLPTATTPPTAAPPTMTALPSPTSAPTAADVAAAPLPTAETPRKAPLPWGIVGGSALLLGLGVGFVLGKTRR